MSLLLVEAAGRDLPIGEVKRLAYRYLGPEAEVTSFGGFHLTGVGGLEAATRWIRLLAAAGMSTVAVAAGLGALAEFLRHGRD